MKLELIKKEEFIKLRANGESFESIAKKIKVSKPTLIKWNRELLKKIEEHKTKFDIEFLRNIQLRTRNRIKNLASELGKAQNALAKYSYEKMTTKELVMLITNYEKQLNVLLQSIDKNKSTHFVLEVIQGAAEVREPDE